MPAQDGPTDKRAIVGKSKLRRMTGSSCVNRPLWPSGGEGEMAKDGDKISLAVLAGDGIGPEITEATVRVLQAAAARSGLDLVLTPHPIGWKAYEQSRSTLAPETVAALRNHMGWILGPTFAGEYPGDDPIKGHPSGCAPNTRTSRWSWSASIPSAPPSRAIPTATGSSPPPISLATSCPTRPPGSPAGSASPRH
jgi:hypothetical protein